MFESEFDYSLERANMDAEPNLGGGLGFRFGAAPRHTASLRKVQSD